MDIDPEDGSTDDAVRGLRTVRLKWNATSDASQGIWKLVGKLLTAKNQNKSTVISMIRKGWNLYEGLDVVEADENTFIFIFVKQEEKERIMRGRPWAILGFLLNIQDWIEFRVIKEIEFSYGPFWIQFHNIPLEGLSKENAIVLGEMIGGVLMVENPVVKGRLIRSYIRARVLVDLRNPMVAGIWVPRPDLPRIWVDVRYEKLPNICYNCGCLGHDSRNCRMKRLMSEQDPRVPMYGPWIGTAPVRSLEDAIVICRSGWDGVEGVRRRKQVEASVEKLSTAEELGRGAGGCSENGEGSSYAVNSGGKEGIGIKDYFYNAKGDAEVRGGDMDVGDLRPKVVVGGKKQDADENMKLQMKESAMNVDRCESEEGLKEKGKMIVEEVSSELVAVQTNVYIVEVPSDDDTTGGEIVLYNQPKVMTDVIERLKKVSLKRRGEDLDDNKVYKKVKKEDVEHSSLLDRVVKKKKIKLGGKVKRKGEAGKRIKEEHVEAFERAELVDVPVAISEEFPEGWFVFQARKEVCHEAEGSGGCPITAT